MGSKRLDNERKRRIHIRNWKRYQREMRGGERRRRRRDWVAISVDLFSDPDFLALDQLHQLCWIGMLCHAGKVGPVFSLSPSDARLLFRLRRTPDFEVLEKQSFIDLEADEHKMKSKKKPAKKRSKSAETFDMPDGLNVAAWDKYLAYRREMGFRAYKKRGAEQAMRKWAKYPFDIQLEAVNTTIENGWQGVFLDKIATQRNVLNAEQEQEKHLAEIRKLGEMLKMPRRPDESMQDYEARVTKMNDRRLLKLNNPY